MICLFLAWLWLLGVPDERLRFKVHIHESADVAAAERFWADVIGVPVESLEKTLLKRHTPRTSRKNIGEDYHGCLIVRVLQSSTEYRRMDGLWCGIVSAARRWPRSTAKL